MCGSPVGGVAVLQGPEGGVAVLQGVWQSCRGCGSHAGGVVVMKGVW